MLFSNVRQVCTVVGDFDATVIRLTEHLGVGPFHCWHWRPPTLLDTTYRGARADWTMKLAITWLDDVQWEVIQPMEGPSLYRDHLELHGRGVQHVLMATGDLSFEEASARLTAKGHPFGQTGRMNPPLAFGPVVLPAAPGRFTRPLNLRFGYIDAESTLRTSIELTRYPLGFSERFSLRSGKPEFTVPAGKTNFERPLSNRAIRRVVKLSIVTRSLEATARAWMEVAGVPRWHLWDERQGCTVAWALVGDMLIELVDPRSSRGFHREILDSRGEGVALLGITPHVSFADAAARLGRAGCERRSETALVGSGQAAAYAARRAFGTDIELIDEAGGPGAMMAREKPDRVLG